MTTTALLLLALQTLLGALDNFLHHELTERLPSRPSARRELALHSVREAIYGVLFLVFAWTEPGGAFAAMTLALLLIEVGVTIADFIEEDRTRRLPAFERMLHTVLAVLYGVFLAVAVPWLAERMGQGSAIGFVSHGLLSWYFTAAALAVIAFAVRNAFAVRRLSQWRIALAPASEPSGRSVLVTGATGFIGSAVVERLAARGDRVIVLSRDRRQARAMFGERVHIVEQLEALTPETQIGAVVNLAGEPILGLPWFAQRRQAIWRSRVDLTADLVKQLALLNRKPRVLVSASAIGFYGDRGDDLLDEERDVGKGFAAELCGAWEGAAMRAAAWGVRTVCLRIGLVLDRNGGALPLMALPARFGLAAVLGSGKQWMSWITRDDLVRMIIAAIDDERWSGAFNAVAPEPSRHAEFQRALARWLGRPQFLHAPALALRALMGEMSSILLFSQRVVPERARALGFSFDVHWVDDALALQLGPPAPALPKVKVRARPVLKAVPDAAPEPSAAPANEPERKRALP